MYFLHPIIPTFVPSNRVCLDNMDDWQAADKVANRCAIVETAEPILQTMEKDLSALIQCQPQMLMLVSGEQLKQFAKQVAAEAIEQAKGQAPNEETEQDELLTSAEVCKEFRTSRPTLWRWTKSGLLHPAKIGTKNVYRRSEIQKLIGGTI